MAILCFSLESVGLSTQLTLSIKSFRCPSATFCSGKTLAKFMIIDDPVVSYTSQVEITILSCFQVTLSVACASVSDSIVGKQK